MTSEFIFGSYLVDIVYKGKHGLYAHKCLNASKYVLALSRIHA